MPRTRLQTTLRNNNIEEFNQLKECIEIADEHQFWKENWNVFVQLDGICFYRLSRDENFEDVNISFKIIVDKDLRVNLCNDRGVAESSELEWILKSSKLEMLSQLHSLLDYYQSEPEIKQQSNQRVLIKQAWNSLEKLTNNLEYAELINPLKEKLASDLSVEEVDLEVEIKQESDESIDSTESSITAEQISKEPNCVAIESENESSVRNESESFEDDIWKALTVEEVVSEVEVQVEDEVKKPAKKRIRAKRKPRVRVKAKVAAKLKPPGEAEVAEKIETFKCQKCDKVFDKKMTFQNHARSVHVSLF